MTDMQPASSAAVFVRALLSAYDLTCPTAYGLTCRAIGVLRPC